MKRSLLDPLPRQLSTTALAALVALVVCGTGVAVARFLESSQGPLRQAPAAVRAAAPTPDGWKSPRTARPSSRGAADSSRANDSSRPSMDGFDGGCSTRATSAWGESSVRDAESTLYRPTVEGS